MISTENIERLHNEAQKSAKPSMDNWLLANAGMVGSASEKLQMIGLGGTFGSAIAAAGFTIAGASAAPAAAMGLMWVGVALAGNILADKLWWADHHKESKEPENATPKEKEMDKAKSSPIKDVAELEKWLTTRLIFENLNNFDSNQKSRLTEQSEKLLGARVDFNSEKYSSKVLLKNFGVINLPQPPAYIKVPAGVDASLLQKAVCKRFCEAAGLNFVECNSIPETRSQSDYHFQVIDLKNSDKLAVFEEAKKLANIDHNLASVVVINADASSNDLCRTLLGVAFDRFGLNLTMYADRDNAPDVGIFQPKAYSVTLDSSQDDLDAAVRKIGATEPAQMASMSSPALSGAILDGNMNTSPRKGSSVQHKI